MNDETPREELREILAAVYEACHAEYMDCPLCSGHIGYQNTHHDDGCPLAEFGPEE